MDDLSGMARNGPWVTGQEAGIIQPAGQGMDGPGSPPAGADAGAPAVTVSDRIPVGTPPGRFLAGYNPAGMTWKPIG
jgi:hypothetical protein